MLYGGCNWFTAITTVIAELLARSTGSWMVRGLLGLGDLEWIGILHTTSVVAWLYIGFLPTRVHFQPSQDVHCCKINQKSKETLL